MDKLIFENVQKGFHGKSIIEIDSLILSQGIYFVSGPNGSGKTTFLKMLAGLIAFSGDITLQGNSLKKCPTEYRRNVSWSEADPVYPEFLTAMDIASLFFNIFKNYQFELKTMIQRFELFNHLNSKLGTFSSGMLKRFSLALAFGGHAKLILLDEPMATLDSEGIGILEGIFKDQSEARTATIIFSSHQIVHELHKHITHTIQFNNSEIIIENVKC